MKKINPEVAADRLSHSVPGAAIHVHRMPGPGLLESVYQKCLAYELRKQGISFAREVWLSVRYEQLTLEAAY